MASDLVTLSWCLGEIRQALNQAEQLLERHLHAEEGDLAALRAARSQLHQAHGALQVVDIEGVSLLTQESEALLDAVERGDVVFGVDVVSRLGQAAQAIVEYLEDLMQGGEAQPLHLYPYYRALLEARRAERVHPADLFFPDLAVTPSPAAAPMMRADAAALAGARGAFERGLLQSIREPGSAAGPQLMHGSVRAVRESVHGSANRAFWWVTEVYFDALRRSLLPLDVGAKRLLARFNLQLRKTLEERAPVSDRLLKDMLFALAGAAPGDAQIDEVRRAYRLDGAIPPDFERPRFGRVDARAMRSAREALARARTAFDKVTRGSASDMPAFAKGVDDFRDAVEQLPAQGLQAIGRVLGDVRRTLNADSAYLPEPVALELATAILYAEQALAQGARPDTQHDRHGAEMAARLSGALSGRAPDADPPDWLRALSQAAQERLTMSTFIAEAQSSLRQVEKVLDGYFRDPTQAVNLPECVRAMHQVGGALRLLGHDAAARGAETVGAQVAAFADHAGESQSEQFEKVAASVGALGFFVEALQHPERASTQYEFDEQAGEFRAHLGLSPRDQASAVSADGEATAAASPEESQAQGAPAGADALAASAGLASMAGALAMAGDSAPLPPPAAEQGAPAPEPVAPLSAESSLAALAQEAVPAYAAWQADPASGATLAGILQRMRDVAALVDDAGRKSACSQAMSLLQSPASDASALRDALLSAGVPLPAPELPAAELPADDLAIDSELLEIFLAEADEVLEAIAEHVRLSAASPRDQDHLTTMRRGFHTLKGSSRMVGLNEFGEAGWAMEQVLNLWLGEERAGDSDLYGLIDRAHGQMREWVERLRSGRGSRIDPTAIIEAAAALRRGEPLPAQESAMPVPADVAVAERPVLEEPVVEEAVLDELVAQTPVAQQPAAPEELGAEPLLDEPAIEMPVLEEPVLEAPVLEEPVLEEPVFESPVLEATASALAVVDEPAALEPELAEAVSDWPALEASAIDWQDDERADVELSVLETAPGDEIDLADAVARTDESVDLADADIGVDFGDLPLDADDADTLLADPTLAESAVAEPSADQAQWADADDDFVIGEPDAMELVQAGAHDEAIATAAAAAPEASAPEPLPSDMVRIGDRTISRPLYLIFLSEADELIQTLTADTAQWRETPLREASEAAMRAVHSLAGSAAVVELEPVHSLAETLDRAYAAQRLSAAVPDDEAFEVISRTVQRVHGMLHQFAAGTWPAADPEVLAALAALVLRWAPPTRIADLTGLPGAGHFDAPVPAGEYPEHRDADASLSSDAVAENSGPALPEHPVDELDPELLAIFIEEADDDLPRIGENLRGWAANPGDARLPQTLMRLLHTVKGGARMAGAMRLGQKLHDTETRVETLAALPTTPVQLIEELVTEVDQAVSMFEALKRPAVAAAGEAVSQPAAVEPAAGEPAPTQASAFAAQPFEAPAVAGAAMLAAGGLAAASGSGDPIVPASADAAAAKSQDTAPAKAADLPVPASHPLVRVRADLLDKLVNEAGEVSIARSRLDNELTTLRQSLADLTENVGRLRSQLREIEIQADTQIQARIAKQKVHEGSFDPLEFDRYTRFQELTRMMAESVNDVATVQGNSMRSLDEASQDLHRQGQVLRDLQQNLMRVRMVQFGSISDRLYRVVRQSAKETDKRVHLDIRGASVEVDRGVLERMAGPIEHLLRNAVAHGIESASTRHAHGKSDTGEIQVEIRQEGREIVLSFNDDGGGLDLARIRLRAISQGLISEQSTPTDRELADLIFVPGFTTAASVTELSGRGVGMDVVRSEVASLGGRIETETQPGRGTRFTVHLPLTLAVAQVVLVAAGKSRFAVPSSSVEQVLQLKPQALAAAYAERSVEWQGQNVPLFFLGSLVESPDVTPVAQHYSPVVIIRSGHQRIALHADEITRNQEVVVKNVGPQVARVRGVTGATVLGNGEIVLIVNPVALAQAAAGEVFDRAIPAPTITAVLPDALPPVVMVVDDSLTVRKVTQRLLTREGYQVMLAKDGVDALRQLQDVVPDAMLLDIEMPRMDGFDLTRNLRADERFAQMPIIMITSRTADKHRNHAMGLGVNVYLGKPYQEDELLAHLAHFTERRHRQVVGVTV